MFRTARQARPALSALWHCCGSSWPLLLVFALPSLGFGAQTFEGEELKDPTRPVGAQLVVGTEGGAGFLADLFGSATSQLNSTYKVTFIRAGGTDPVAMINEKLVKTGDMIGEAEVIAIDAQSVSLRVDGSIQRVTSYNDTLKTLAQPR